MQAACLAAWWPCAAELAAVIEPPQPPPLPPVLSSATMLPRIPLATRLWREEGGDAVSPVSA
jgi:hypothetical protein